VKNKFNYIVTCHNKEELIELVIMSLLYVSSIESNIFIVLDGCTDSSELKVDKIINKYIERKITKLYADDVHELMAINVALNSIDLDEKALNIIVQDDILLMDNLIEQKLDSLYTHFSGKLGIVSLRHGANLSLFKLWLNRFYLYPMVEYVHTIFGHGNVNKNLNDGEFVQRHIAIKSPICIPNIYVKELGLCDEIFSPWDDFEYCIRGVINGFVNGVFGINYYSHVSWGTMRNLKQKASHDTIVKNNISKLKVKYKNLIVPKVDRKRFILKNINGEWRLFSGIK
jgi:hypothetical protein